MEKKIRELQVSFHRFTESFLNGYSLTNQSKLLYPLIDRSIVPEELIENIEHNRKIIPMTFGFLKSNRKINKPETIAELIKVFHQEFYRKTGGKKLSKTISINTSFKDWNEKRKRLNIDDEKTTSALKINDFVNKKLSLELANFFIHGSLSTLDYTRWSDIDLLGIIKEETILDKNRLLNLRKNMIKLNASLFENDPLQHHGVFLINEFEMKNYSQSFFPVELFKYSTALLNTDKLIFNVRNSKGEAKETLFELINYVETFQSKKNISMYDWKLFCHIMLLIPAIYLECKGRYLYKKYSFRDAKKDFSENEWRIIEKMTEMRDKFYYNPFWLRIITKQRINFWPNVLAARFLTRAPK
ncbi:MAG: hypothetical protein GQ477_05070, partial [Nanohaloarchaea archaeon]|nr:hypothetical protein [Candidatus Nanohaloarchaea archaeon]